MFLFLKGEESRMYILFVQYRIQCIASFLTAHEVRADNGRGIIKIRRWAHMREYITHRLKKLYGGQLYLRHHQPTDVNCLVYTCECSYTSICRSNASTWISVGGPSRAHELKLPPPPPPGVERRKDVLLFGISLRGNIDFSPYQINCKLPTLKFIPRERASTNYSFPRDWRFLNFRSTENADWSASMGLRIEIAGTILRVRSKFDCLMEAQERPTPSSSTAMGIQPRIQLHTYLSFEKLAWCGMPWHRVHVYIHTPAPWLSSLTIQ